MKEQIAQLLGALVSIRSVEGNAAGKRAAVDFSRQWLEENGLTTVLHDHAESPSLVVDLPGRGDPVLLLAHLDVVPAPDALFTMRREGDRVFGRGVIDDKGQVVMLMLLLAEMSKWEARPALRVLFTTDEEIGSANGVIRLLGEGALTPARAVIALDGGDERTVVIREKGVLHFLLQATGKAAHNSQPWTGDNAIEKLWRTYERMKAALPPTADPGHWHETVSIGKIAGGEFVNQVPGYAEAQIDVRYTESFSDETIRALLARQLEEGVRMNVLSGGECFATDAGDEFLRAYMAAMEAHGISVKTEAEHGATDARFFARLGVPIFIHNPDGDGLHTDDEWMDLASAERVLKGLIGFCGSLAD